MIIPQLNFLTNTAFLGRVGETELGVNGITGVYYLILSMIGYGFSNAVQVLMARRSGEGDHEGLARIFANSILLSLFSSFGLMLLSLWLAPLIFGLSLHDNEHILLSVNYLYIRVWGLPFLMLTQLANAFFISTGQSRYLIVGSIVSTVVNIVADYFLIFGKSGFPKLGLEGAAVASVMADICFCMTMYGIFYFRQQYRKYPVIAYFKFDTALAQNTLKVAAPLVVQYMFSIGGWQVFFIFVEHLGEPPLAASQILRSVFGIMGLGTWAFAATCNTMVSNVIGQGKSNEVLSLVTKIAKISLGITAAICLVLLSFSTEFLSLYTEDVSLIVLARPSLYVIVTATLIMSVSSVLFNAVLGTGNTMVNLFIEVFCVGCYLVYCYIVIERNHMSLQWAWGSEFVYWTTLFTTSILYLKYGRWRGKAI